MGILNSGIQAEGSHHFLDRIAIEREHRAAKLLKEAALLAEYQGRPVQEYTESTLKVRLSKTGQKPLTGNKEYVWVKNSQKINGWNLINHEIEEMRDGAPNVYYDIDFVLSKEEAPKLYAMYFLGRKANEEKSSIITSIKQLGIESADLPNNSEPHIFVEDVFYHPEPLSKFLSIALTKQ